MSDYNPDGRRRRSSRSEEPISTGLTGTSRNRRAPRQALGRSADLQAREEALREERRRMAEVTYGDSYQVYQPQERRSYAPPTQPPRRKHTGFWLAVVLLCVICLATLALLVLPQLAGGPIFSVVPNYAFVNGSIITYDAETAQRYNGYKQYMSGDAIFPGVTIDGIDVGGMTMQQAKDVLGGVSALGGGEFAISVTVDGNTWVIDSNQVPMTRNVDAMVRLAWSYGRSNSTEIRGTRTTPFQQRIGAVTLLQQQPVQLATSLTYDKASIRGLTDGIANSVNVAPIDASVAYFDFSSKNFYFNADVSGKYIDPQVIYDQVMWCLEHGQYFAELELHTTTQLAGVTRSELASSFCRISSYTTKTTDNKNRNTNVRLSAEAINGMVVQPGETFSFNAATGQRTEEKGYKPAAAIAGGAVNDEVGGGVCQTSSTLFNAVARADLEIVSRSPHAWPSSYVAEGMDATVNWPNLDFKWRNNSDYPIYIVAWYDNRKVTVELYGRGLGDGVTIDLEHEKVKDMPAPTEVKEVNNPNLAPGTRKKTVSRRDGSVWETYQVWYRNGQEFKRERLCKSTYKVYQETIEWN